MNLEDRLNNKIAEAAPYFEQVCGVVIIHYLNPSTVIYMSENGLKRLNTSIEELHQMGTDYFTRFFNPEDAAFYVPKFLGMLEKNNDSEIISYFQQVRACKNEEWEWYTCGTRLFMQDDDGKPFATITIAIPIEANHYFTAKIERLLSENIFLRQHHGIFNQLTSREIDILKFMATDTSSMQIATTLNISENTVNTHRRNIRSKLQVKSQYEITKFAQAFDLI